MTALIDALTANRTVTSLDEADEAATVLRAQSGDKAAVKILLDNYLGLLVQEVGRIVRRAGGFVQDFDTVTEDLFTDAVLVFYRVIEKYQPGRGRFDGLLKTALRNDPTLNDFLSNVRTMRVPQSVMRRRTAALKAAGGDPVKAREIVSQFGITRETYDAITQVYQSNNTINNPDENTPAARVGSLQLGGRGGGSQDLTPSYLAMTEPGYVHVDHLHDVRKALFALDFEERDVICGLFGLDGWPEHTQTELATELGVSRTWVRKRLQTAMVKMQAQFNDKESA